MPSFLFACFLLIFLEERRKYQEYRRKEKLPRQYCRTSKLHGRYSVHEDKRDAQAKNSILCLYSLRDDKTCNTIIVASHNSVALSQKKTRVPYCK